MLWHPTLPKTHCRMMCIVFAVQLWTQKDSQHISRYLLFPIRCSPSHSGGYYSHALRPSCNCYVVLLCSPTRTSVNIHRYPSPKPPLGAIPYSSDCGTSEPPGPFYLAFLSLIVNYLKQGTLVSKLPFPSPSLHLFPPPGTISEYPRVYVKSWLGCAARCLQGQVFGEESLIKKSRFIWRSRNGAAQQYSIPFQSRRSARLWGTTWIFSQN